MPTYVYRCRKGHTFELFHGISEDKPRRCPTCRSSAVRIPSGGAGLLFKGSGFYITDYRSAGYQAAATEESGKRSEPAPSSGTTGPGAPSPGGAGAPAAPASASAPAQSPGDGASSKPPPAPGTRASRGGDSSSAAGPRPTKRPSRPHKPRG